MEGPLIFCFFLLEKAMLYHFDLFCHIVVYIYLFEFTTLIGYTRGNACC